YFLALLISVPEFLAAAANTFVNFCFGTGLRGRIILRNQFGNGCRWKPPPPLPTEIDRLKALRAYNVLDSPPEEAFDDLTRLASQICQTPVALVSLVDADRDWFKSRVGLNVPQTPRDASFAAHALAQTDLFVVPDTTMDARFSGNPLVTGSSHIRFYA